MPPKFSRGDAESARPSERASLLDDLDSDEDGANIFSGPEKFRHVPPKDGISRVKSEIRGVMDVMQNNISKVLDRGAKLEDLQDKSESLDMNAFNFRQGSKKLQRKLWWQSCRLKLILAFIVIIVLIIIIVPIALKKEKKAT